MNFAEGALPTRVGLARLAPYKFAIVAALVALVFAAFTWVVEPRVNSLYVSGSEDWRGWSSGAQPLVLNLAELANLSSSEMELLTVTSEGRELGDSVRFGITRSSFPDAPVTQVDWFSRGNSVTIAPDESVWLWVSVAVHDGLPQGFQKLEVHFRDGLPWERVVDAYVRVMAVPEGLPDGIDSFDGRIDSLDYSEYLDAFVLAMQEGDPATIAAFLGPNATRSDAEQFLERQREIDADAGYMWSEASETTAEVRFSRQGYDRLGPPFIVTWQHNRWSVLQE